MSLIDSVTAWLPNPDLMPRIAAAAMTARTELELPTVLENDRGQFEPGPSPVAVADFSPGNGFRYLMVLTALDGSNYAGTPFPTDALLVSLPEHHRCLVLDRDAGYHMPAYVDEKLRIGHDHAAVVAAFTTLVTAPMTPSGTGAGEGVEPAGSA